MLEPHEVNICDEHVQTPPAAPRQVIELIGGLYDIEADIRGKPAAQRLRVRQEKLMPQVTTI
ncbi:transposase [Pandoraea anapnoica]|uniref:Transposase n=1 Tax=Pandoraea anapnoica TaxID=2508301 RepID=A0A5E5AQ53_9BURK|nr:MULTISPECIES: hypothetical protein [Pandoraea]VVE59205.1 transposase [Pandoraea iniqua]VVE75869.1 transposase [Pandoraea anapnoica]